MKKKIPAFISIVLAFVLLFSLASCDNVFVNGVEEEVSTVTAKSVLPTEPTSHADEDSGQIIEGKPYTDEEAAKNTIEILNYALPLMNALKSEKAAQATISMGQDKSIGKAAEYNEKGEPVRDEEGNVNTVDISDNKVVNATVDSLKNLMLDESGMEVSYEDSKDSEKVNEILPLKDSDKVIELTNDDFESATCVDNDETGERVITMKIKNDTDSAVMADRMSRVFDTEDVDAILKEFEKASNYLKVGEPSFRYRDCYIVLRIDNQTDRITQIQYVKCVDVNVEITGVGSLESIGTVPTTFNYTDVITYDFNYEDPNAKKDA